MSDLNRDIGLRIRGVRELNDLTSKTFAERIGIADALLAQYESGSVEIPVSILHEIHTEFGVGMSELLTGESARLSIYSVTRKNQGVGIDKNKAYGYESLAYNFSGRIMDPYLITIEPKEEGAVLPTNTHDGQEFHYVMEGSVRVKINKYEVVLDQGDSIYFDSAYPHAIWAQGGRPAKLLVTITL